MMQSLERRVLADHPALAGRAIDRTPVDGAELRAEPIASGALRPTGRGQHVRAVSSLGRVLKLDDAGHCAAWRHVQLGRRGVWADSNEATA